MPNENPLTLLMKKRKKFQDITQMLNTLFTDAVELMKRRRGVRNKRSLNHIYGKGSGKLLFKVELPLGTWLDGYKW